MKRFIALFCITICSVLCLFSLSACTKKDTLENYVSELRSNLYLGTLGDLNIKASYGFREVNQKNDGVASEKANLLTFKLLCNDDNRTSYKIKLTHNQTDYQADFKLNPVTDSVTAVMEIDGFDQNEFTVFLIKGSDKQEILMSSIVPKNAMDYKTALIKLKELQSPLLDNYTDQNGNFNAEIHARILVKDQTPYWYVGIVTNNDVKALLMDGVSGEVLAVRKVL